jgi:hypothetical protein
MSTARQVAPGLVAGAEYDTGERIGIPFYDVELGQWMIGVGHGLTRLATFEEVDEFLTRTGVIGGTIGRPNTHHGRQ